MCLHTINNDPPGILEEDDLAAWELLKMIDNPYLENFIEITGNPHPTKIPNLKELLFGERVDLNDDCTLSILKGCDNLQQRRDLTRKYSWAIPNDDALYAIRDLKMSIIEIGAGNGYWASLLAQLGIEVVAFDNALTNNHYISGELFFNVQIGSHEQLHDDKYNSYALMLCWPPYDEPFALDCLKAYSGSIIVYIGEWRGCTACDEFHDELDENWEEVKSVVIPQWFGLHDHLWIYKRKEGSKE